MMNYKKIIALYGMDAYKKHYKATKSNWILASDDDFWTEDFVAMKNLKYNAQTFIFKNVFNFNFSNDSKGGVELAKRVNKDYIPTKGYICFYNEKNDIAFFYYVDYFEKFLKKDYDLKKILSYIEKNYMNITRINLNEI